MAMDVRSSAPGEFGSMRLVAATINFNSAGGTVDLGALEAGDVVMRAWAQVLTAFNAGTTNVLTLGDGTTADKYLAAADVTEGTPGVSPAGGKGPFNAETAAGTLRATYTQTGTPATTGSARIYVQLTKAAT